MRNLWTIALFVLTACSTTANKREPAQVGTAKEVALLIELMNKAPATPANHEARFWNAFHHKNLWRDWKFDAQLDGRDHARSSFLVRDAVPEYNSDNTRIFWGHDAEGKECAVSLTVAFGGNAQIASSQGSASTMTFRQLNDRSLGSLTARFGSRNRGNARLFRVQSESNEATTRAAVNPPGNQVLELSHRIFNGGAINTATNGVAFPFLSNGANRYSESIVFEYNSEHIVSIELQAENALLDGSKILRKTSKCTLD